MGLGPFNKNRPTTEITASEMAYLSLLKKRIENPTIGMIKSKQNIQDGMIPVLDSIKSLPVPRFK